jgi:dolichol-phosphate mannosyltransferase
MKNKKTLFQLIRFGFSGGAGVIAGYITLYTLTEFAGVWYLFSSVAAGIVNGGINFFLEKFWTFQNKDKEHIYTQAKWYTILRISLFASDVGLMYIFVEYFHIYYLFAQIFITIILSIISFIVCRKIFLTEEPKIIIN